MSKDHPLHPQIIDGEPHDCLHCKMERREIHWCEPIGMWHTGDGTDCDVCGGRVPREEG